MSKSCPIFVQGLSKFCQGIEWIFYTDMDIELGQIVYKSWILGLEPMAIYFIDKIWT